MLFMDSFIDDEMINLMEYFTEKETYFNKLCKNYLHSRENLEKEVQEKTVRVENAKGGIFVHRGYYCPSLVPIGIISRESHGRILEKVSRKMSYDYLYCFDSQDHLICARNCVDDKFGKKLSISEYILYMDGLEIGIKYHTFSDDLCFIEQISECRYKDGRLVEYLLANILPVVSGATISGLECSEISYEKYHFLADRLQSCFESKYYSDYNGKRFIASENIYYFIYDETGEISKYKVTPYKDGVRDDFYTETFYSVRRPPTKNSKSRQKETLNADNTVNYLKKRIKTDVLDIRKAWDVFKAFCRLPLVGEDEKAILFQCGVHNFTGKSLFHYSFVRQFDAYQKKEDVWQMVQLHCEYTFKVTAELKKLLASEFYFGSDGGIDNYFKRIESLPEFQIPQREKPLHLSIYQELVD